MQRRFDPIQRRSAPSAPWAWRYVILAVSVHVFALYVLDALLPTWMPEERSGPTPVSLVILQPSPAEPSDIPEAPPQPTGQIVDLAPPQEEVEPTEADYLAEHAMAVEDETRTKQFKINPEILARVFSNEEKMEREDLIDLHVDKPSTGAQVGNDRFDPDRDGNLASLPSPWAMTNRDGTQDPVPAAHMSSDLAGAPQNDLLRERVDERLELNTKEFLFSAYLKRIRSAVNFYWDQNIDNLPSSVRVVKSQYLTRVEVILNSDGAVEYLEVVEPSGNEVLDDCVVRAFRLAGPFPNPPEGLIEKDGRVYLPNMGFTVQFMAARAQYRGIDPRAGVQFPGILKSPR